MCSGPYICFINDTEKEFMNRVQSVVVSLVFLLKVLVFAACICHFSRFSFPFLSSSGSVSCRLDNHFTSTVKLILDACIRLYIGWSLLVLGTAVALM